MVIIALIFPEISSTYNFYFATTHLYAFQFLTLWITRDLLVNAAKPESHRLVSITEIDSSSAKWYSCQIFSPCNLTLLASEGHGKSSASLNLADQT